MLEDKSSPDDDVLSADYTCIDTDRTIQTYGLMWALALQKQGNIAPQASCLTSIDSVLRRATGSPLSTSIAVAAGNLHSAHMLTIAGISYQVCQYAQ